MNTVWPKYTQETQPLHIFCLTISTNPGELNSRSHQTQKAARLVELNVWHFSSFRCHNFTLLMCQNLRLTRDDPRLLSHPGLDVHCHNWDSANEGQSLPLSGEQRATGRGHWPLTSQPTGHNPCWFSELFLPGRSFAHDLCYGSIPWAQTSPRAPPLIKEPADQTASFSHRLPNKAWSLFQ